jgi:hypothetical protein
MNDSMTEVATMTRVAPPARTEGFVGVEWEGNRLVTRSPKDPEKSPKNSLKKPAGSPRAPGASQ